MNSPVHSRLFLSIPVSFFMMQQFSASGTYTMLLDFLSDNEFRYDAIIFCIRYIVLYTPV